MTTDVRLIDSQLVALTANRWSESGVMAVLARAFDVHGFGSVGSAGLVAVNERGQTCGSLHAKIDTPVVAHALASGVPYVGALGSPTDAGRARRAPSPSGR